MTSLDQLLTDLVTLKIQIWAEGDRLRCSAPTGTLTPELQSRLQTHKADILALLQQSYARSPMPDSIQPVARSQPIPLSFAQQRLWFFDQLQPGSAAYTIAFAVRLTGLLQVPILSQALTEIVCRHETLRTTFATVQGEPAQVIANPSAVSVPLVDIQGLPSSQQNQEVSRLVANLAEQPFHLATGPLFRVLLLRLNDTHHVVALTLHHSIADGWSTDVLMREFATLYEAFLTGSPSPLPPLPIQYADFAIWQRQRLQGNGLEQQRAYWQQQLAGSLPALQLPSDRPRPAVQTFRGATQSFAVSQELTNSLKHLSQQENATLFMLLLAAFKTLLWRYTGQDDVLVGSPIVNRPRSELENLIGFFVNTLVLRTDLSGNPRFRSLLQRVRDVTLGAYAHQDLPFEQVVEMLTSERSLSYHPLFQVMFVLQAPAQPFTLQELTLSPIPYKTHTTKFDLTLSLTETEMGLKGNVEYSTDLFNADTIVRLIHHFQLLLAGIVQHPDQPLSDLPLLSAQEQRQRLVEWNLSAANYPVGHCWHELVEAQVERSPNAVAVVWQDEHLTYAELNRRSNQLAHYLVQLGVKPDVRVGICVERSPAQIIALLGVLKAGGAYVPLDPTYPQDRLAFMLSDAHVSVLLTQESLLTEWLPVQAAIVCLDRDWSTIAQAPDYNPTSGVSTENLAYLIYTSGSTGTPKGVLVPHAGLGNLTTDKIRTCNVEATSRVLQFFSLSFDASIPEIVMALGAGATLCLGTSASLQPGAALVNLLREQSITHMTLTPSALAALPFEALPALQMILVGGEACAPELITQWSKGRLFINAYGPTEVTVNASMQPCGNGHSLLPTVRPSANKQLYVLDQHLQLVPVGVPGELYIGGMGLARGYLNHPIKTAESFIPNPFSDIPSSRLYRTGDLVRTLPNGSIEFLGRVDHQVKIRGFRIEPGEIEAVLNQHPSIVTSVVMAREDNPGAKRLVAYVVPDSNVNFTTSELRRFLRTQLPDYMVPAAFVPLETLPLSPNGKVDRKALPSPDTARPDLDTQWVAPRTAVEARLADLWSHILKVEQVGTNDNFFELGGHSLLIVQLLTRIRETFQVDLPLQVLFAEPTIAGLAEQIEQARQGNPLLQPSPLTLDLNADIVLDASISPAHAMRLSQSEPRHVLLTGATGFLGVFLLHELLQQSSAIIYCLVRATNVESGQQKLDKALNAYGLEGDRHSSRIIPIIGDLSQPRLGLSTAQFNALADQIDVIYHNGATVNHTAPYASLKAANVFGTQEVLRLACQSRVKPVHFISTISVFSSADIGSDTNGSTLIDEWSDLGDRPPADGYTQSKWVAEKLVAIARDRGLPVSIYRPGRISGHSQTGVFNPNDFLYKLIMGCIQLGSAPVGDMRLDILPVDYVSKAIIHLSRQPESCNNAFHLIHLNPVSSQLLLDQIRSVGFLIEQLPYEQWRSHLLQIAERSPDHPLYPLIPLFPARTAESSASSSLSISCQITWNALAKESIPCPPIDAALFATYLSYLTHKGYLTGASLDVCRVC
ncbi:amino acid adenylation domain-containing protein [Oculatella sp. LEGE 06141]|uniref:non-ribosomal peptide synthetase n=1 Tax=Oculatella sp. LEGE 06141 TaxID=1828648 RepID=UPI00187ECC03|nr:non-ribosomal peptide synthetase [Oculatella sp. LEGE 06141]MBE9178530.1 amino acid adenylation domain-containing protein [Oculatella sp. LEGE 06141]